MRINQAASGRQARTVRIVTRGSVTLQDKISDETKSVKATILRLPTTTLRIRELANGELIIEIEPP